MPYDLKKARGKNLYWVITKGTNKKHSKEPLPLEKAIAQMRALYANVPDARGKGLSPSDQLEISKTTYGNAKPKIGNAQLMKETKTLKFYKEGNNIIIGVRGTKDWKDWISNFSLAVRDKSIFRATPRITEDIAEIKEFQKQYPPSQYHYSGVGHSLGGAVVDELIDQGLIKEGRSYNPAVHLEDLHKGVDKNKRVYEEKDPLRVIGLLAGQKQGDLDVRRSVIGSEDPLEHHKISNPAFEGGGKGHSKMPISSVPPVETSTKQRNENTYFEKKGDPFLVIKSVKPDGEKSFVQFFTPEDFFKSYRWETIKQSDQYSHHKQLLLLAKEWRKLNDKPEVEEEEEGSGYGGMMPYAEHKKKMKELREENLAKQRAKSNFSPIQVPPPPPPPPPLKSNRKIVFSYYRTAPPVFKGEGIHGKFHQQIIQAGMTPESYMRAILKNAKANGYGEYTADIEFSDDDVHKLMIKTEIDGRSRTERFGRVGYGDFVLWNHSNPEKAQSKKDTFHRSHEAMKGKWRNDPLSPNNLSLHILW